MMSKMDEILRKILNDKDIFWPKKEIFSTEEWSSLKEKFRKNNFDECKNDIQKKIEEYEKKINQISNSKKREELREEKTLCENLIKAISEKPNILGNLFEYLDSFGLIKSNLPSPSAMDDYGKVIERYGIEIVQQFFMDKIKKENDRHRKKALIKLLEYVKDLYQSNQSPLEIAYFVRKLNSLEIIWEVLNE